MPVASDTPYASFAIGFDRRDRARVHSLWDEVIDSNRWSEGPMVERFEAGWERQNGLPAVAGGSWFAGALAALEFAEVAGETVLCPSNTFMATPLAIRHAGGKVAWVDCNREDLCVSFDHFEEMVERERPKAAVVVHIGGHIAFEIERIAALCRERGIFLLEDCAHAHGASWNGSGPGSYGDAGVYSLYATKTISAGEGGVLVSKRPEVVEWARKHRNYGKFEHEVPGINGRMSEFSAALGLVGVERLPEIVAWKNAVAREHLDPAHPGRLELPEGMTSGLYKYIVFDPLERSTGKVYEEPCHRIAGDAVDLPNTDWAAESHWCAPLYYHGGEE